MSSQSVPEAPSRDFGTHFVSSLPDASATHPKRSNLNRVAIYARVSTGEQTTQNQVDDLRRYCSDRNWAIVEEFVDQGVSGAKQSRPALDRLMNAVRKRQADIVLVWRFDRFARSVKHLVLALDELRRLNVAFISYQENIDTGSPLGQAIFTIIAAMAELERSIIVERVHAGLRRAKAEGKKLGRPLAVVNRLEIEHLKRQGLSLREIGQRLKVGKSTVGRLLRTGVEPRRL